MVIKKKYLILIFSLFAFFVLATQNKVWINKVAKFYGERASRRVVTWQQLIEQIQDKTEQEQLIKVNNFFNQLRFVDDIELWGKKDYWATPLEFLGTAAGDCEDFSIAKYYTLRELGIEDNKLRLVYVKAIRLNQFHMVVAYYPQPSAEPLLLDNIDPQVKLASKRKDLLPIYSFNGSKLWLMKERGRGELVGDPSKLGLWNSLRHRMDIVELQKPIKYFDG